nr:Chromate resistance protein ChrB [Rhodococcus phenolicus]
MPRGADPGRCHRHRRGSEVDQVTITGEPRPVDKTTGDEVFAGTANGTGVLRLRVVHWAADSVIAHITTLVEEAGRTKATTQLFTLAELDEEEQSLERLRRWYRDLQTRDVFGAANALQAQERLRECVGRFEDYAEQVMAALHTVPGRSGESA